MSQDMPFELPKATEKLSYKFILDTIRDRKIEESSQHLEVSSLEDIKLHKTSTNAECSSAVEAASGNTESNDVTEAISPRALHSNELEPQNIEISNQPIEVPTLVTHGSLGEPPLETQPLQKLVLPSEKKYFRIGEVSQLIGVEPYVLRYWESEFKLVRPSKSGSGHRVYSRKDVETLHHIRHLLHVEKFSIKGAKKKLLEKRREAQSPVDNKNINASSHRAFLKSLQQQLRDLLAAAKDL